MTSYKTSPDFIIIGSMKSGTTTLYDDLSTIESLYLPSDKEPSILSKYTSLEEIKENYKYHYSKAKNNQLCGEASTIYTSIPIHKCVVDKAYELCGPNLKMIMIMRDPLERIYSHLRHDIAGKHIDVKDINELVLEDPRYISISDYPMQLNPWVNIFGINNILCLSFIEYIKDRKDTVKIVLDHLGVDYPINRIASASIKNKSSELRYTNKNIGAILNSNFYKRYLRSIFSDKYRKIIKNLILPKVCVPEFKLDKNVEKIVLNKLSHVEKEIQEITGKNIIINSCD